MDREHWIGLDFGGQKSGNTCIAVFEKHMIQYKQASQKENADDWLMDYLKQNEHIQRIFIDAPLSLPSAYYSRGSNYMFRQADKEVRGMSPMYLGALTARAIRLYNEMKNRSVQMIETYPAKLEQLLFGQKSAKKGKVATDRIDHLYNMIQMDIKPPQNRHQYDALLAWVSAWRYDKRNAQTYGDAEEGLIVV